MLGRWGSSFSPVRRGAPPELSFHLFSLCSHPRGVLPLGTLRAHSNWPLNTDWGKKRQGAREPFSQYICQGRSALGVVRTHHRCADIDIRSELGHRNLGIDLREAKGSNRLNRSQRKKQSYKKQQGNERIDFTSY